MVRTLAHHTVNLLNYANRLKVAVVAAVSVVVRARRVEVAVEREVAIVLVLLTRPKVED